MLPYFKDVILRGTNPVNSDRVCIAGVSLKSDKFSLGRDNNIIVENIDNLVARLRPDVLPNWEIITRDLMKW